MLTPSQQENFINILKLQPRRTISHNENNYNSNSLQSESTETTNNTDASSIRTESYSQNQPQTSSFNDSIQNSSTSELTNINVSPNISHRINELITSTRNNNLNRTHHMTLRAHNNAPSHVIPHL